MSNHAVAGGHCSYWESGETCPESDRANIIQHTRTVPAWTKHNEVAVVQGCYTQRADVIIGRAAHQTISKRDLPAATSLSITPCHFAHIVHRAEVIPIGAAYHIVPVGERSDKSHFVIGMAAVVCCAAAISGDVLQSMSSGHMIGATPWRMQVAEMVGVIAAAPILGLVVSSLHSAYTIGSPNLPAPQAFLMAGVVRGVLGGEMVWPYVIAGAVLAFMLILMDLPVLPVAIGTYLPFSLTIPIFAGGIVRAVVDRRIERLSPGKNSEEIGDWEMAVKQKGVNPKEKARRTGILFTAGLIAGEALMGVIAAFLIIGHIDLQIFDVAPSWPGLLVWGYIAFLIGYLVLREFSKAQRKMNAKA